MNHGIDVHTHIVPESFPAYTGGARDVPWPSMSPVSCGHAHVMISGRKYRTVPESCWRTEVRRAEMDAMRIGRQVLSPMPELLSYWLPLQDASLMCRYLNEEIVRMVAAEPGRFLGFGIVPLQDVGAAIRELEFVVSEAKLSGVEVASNVNGLSIGDPRLDPFFAAVSRLGAAVFVHALRPAGKDRLVGPPELEQIVAFPGDIGLAGASLITGGMLERYPDLHIALSHGGGALPAMVPRMENGWRVSPVVAAALPKAPSVYARQLFCDTLTYSPDTLRLAMKTFGEDKVMMGTDYPFIIRDPDPHATVEALGLAAPQMDALREGNARRFLRL